MRLALLERGIADERIDVRESRLAFAPPPAEHADLAGGDVLMTVKKRGER